MKGKLILVEGYKGSGKTSLINSLAEKLTESGEDFVVVREPGGTVVGEALRTIILSTEGLDEYTRLCLFLASRRVVYNEQVLPALEAGRTVICDRGYISTFSNQLVSPEFGGIAESHTKDFCLLANHDILPDILLYLDTSLDTCIENRINENTGEVHYNGRDIVTHTNVYNGLTTAVTEARKDIRTIYLPYRNGIEANSLVCLSAIKNLIKD